MPTAAPALWFREDLRIASLTLCAAEPPRHLEEAHRCTRTPARRIMASQLKLSFQASVGSSVRMAEALRIASSLFTEGMAQLNGGNLTEALALFEQSLSINQRYLQPSKTECVLCYNHIAAVHDKLGNLQQAFTYYERAKQQLSGREPPKGERGVLSRRKRAELLKHVQGKLDLMPRTVGPKVGAGVPLAHIRQLFQVSASRVPREYFASTSRVPRECLSSDSRVALMRRRALDGLLQNIVLPREWHLTTQRRSCPPPQSLTARSLTASAVADRLGRRAAQGGRPGGCAAVLRAGPLALPLARDGRHRRRLRSAAQPKPRRPFQQSARRRRGLRRRGRRRQVRMGTECSPRPAPPCCRQARERRASSRSEPTVPCSHSQPTPLIHSSPLSRFDPAPPRTRPPRRSLPRCLSFTARSSASPRPTSARATRCKPRPTSSPPSTCSPTPQAPPSCRRRRCRRRPARRPSRRPARSPARRRRPRRRRPRRALPRRRLRSCRRRPRPPSTCVSLGASLLSKARRARCASRVPHGGHIERRRYAQRAPSICTASAVDEHSECHLSAP